jgi:ribonuclease P protein subunit POP4
MRHELIGLQCRVLKSRNSRQEGLGGIVADETRNTIVIMRNEKVSKVAKAGAEFVFTLPSGRKVKVSGSLILARPENRIKIRLRKW